MTISNIGSSLDEVIQRDLTAESPNALTIEWKHAVKMNVKPGNEWITVVKNQVNVQSVGKFVMKLEKIQEEN
jgi:hypothetical protein